MIGFLHLENSETVPPVRSRKSQFGYWNVHFIKALSNIRNIAIQILFLYLLDIEEMSTEKLSVQRSSSYVHQLPLDNLSFHRVCCQKRGCPNVVARKIFSRDGVLDSNEQEGRVMCKFCYIQYRNIHMASMAV